MSHLVGQGSSGSNPRPSGYANDCHYVTEAYLYFYITAEYTFTLCMLIWAKPHFLIRTIEAQDECAVKRAYRYMSDGLCLALALRVGMPTTVHINMTYNSESIWALHLS